MGLLGSLTKTVMNVVTLPIVIAIDVAELPFRVMDGEIPGTYTAEHLKKIRDDLLD